MDERPPDEELQRGAVFGPSALPSTGARLLAFGSILLAGVCGGLIGFAVTDLQCSGGCTTLAGLGGLAGALIAAAGVSIVAVLVLRAMGEWRSQQAADEE